MMFVHKLILPTILSLCEGCSVPGALLEKWNSIDGSTVTDLLGSVQYNCKQPDETTVITDKLKADPSRGSKFGDRLTTYIVPNITGTYNFYVASDDYSELWLSTDENPSNMTMIAYVNGYTGDEVWDKYSSQKSEVISLIGGKAYYMKVLHKEGGYVSTDRYITNFSINELLTS